MKLEKTHNIFYFFFRISNQASKKEKCGKKKGSFFKIRHEKKNKQVHMQPHSIGLVIEITEAFTVLIQYRISESG